MTTPDQPLPPHEPAPTKLDVRGRLCGVPLRIHPWFWLASAATGIRYIADPEAGSLGYFSFWIAAALACVLLHALAQAGAARLFGTRCGILLYGLGSLTLGLEAVPRCWKRVCVLLAGPAIQFVLVGAIWGLTALPFPGFLIVWGWQSSIATGAAMLVTLNLWWGILNLLPIWPLAGGRIVVDVGETLAGTGGRTAALMVSLIAIGLLSILVVFDTSAKLNNHFDPRFPMYLSEGVVGVAFCFLLWLLGFKELLR